MDQDKAWILHNTEPGALQLSSGHRGDGNLSGDLAFPVKAMLMMQGVSCIYTMYKTNPNIIIILLFSIDFII